MASATSACPKSEQTAMRQSLGITRKPSDTLRWAEDSLIELTGGNIRRDSEKVRNGN